MKRLFLILWFALPVGAAMYHFGPGQGHLRLDEAARLVAEGEAHAARAAEHTAAGEELRAKGEWAKAEEAYEAALGLVGAESPAARRALALERAKCRMQIGELPEANAELLGLVAELASDAEGDPAQLRDARGALASSQYYMTWLMRLEGAPRSEWEPRIESARQLNKIVTEDADGRGDAEALATAQEDLEAAIRLERMAIKDLQGLPIPSQ